ncbi:GPN-loop GTPase 2-like [Branchiostoma lanceolatum]|uniref:GPN-loop GTPase 2-like n=1 Tax=Branchiostoma lanceolatum TaxID=7740 RepID=UPI003452D7B3
MPFGQVVIGPPGSGKTTYCRAMHEFLTGLGRKVTIVNLDPANDTLPYECTINMQSLITLEDVMEKLRLGPNGGLIYCMEFLEKNLDWLQALLEKQRDHFFLVDCPGQVELYTHHNSVRNIVAQLQKWDFRLVSVHLVDSHYCSDPSKFVSVLLTSLATMVQMELPHVNVLSKIDLVEKFGKLDFNLDFYTDVLDLQYLFGHLEGDPFFAKYKKLNEAIVGVVEDYSLVTFVPLNVQDKDSMTEMMKAADRAIGYHWGEGEDRTLQAIMSSALGADYEYITSAQVQEKYMKEEGEEEQQQEEKMDIFPGNL